MRLNATAGSTDAESNTMTREQILAERENGKVLLVLKNKVYDVTEFLPDHPGGGRPHHRHPRG